MAEEEKDDWLDDLDDDEGDSELDQSDIESLLSDDDSADDESADSADSEVDIEDAGEIDSADIDSLLSGTDDDLGDTPDNDAAAEEGTPEEEVEDFEALSDDESAEDSGDELEAAADDGGELDEPSEDIDATSDEDTASDGDAGAEVEVAGDGDVGGEEPEDDIGQSDIDALLSETDASGDEDALEDPDQNEIDKLFSEVDDDDAPGSEEDPFQAEEIDFKDVIDSEEQDDEFMDGTGTAFDAEEFGIDDEMPDVSDLASAGDDEETAIFDETSESKESSDEATVLMGSDGDTKGGGASKIALLLASMPPALQERKTQGIIGGCLVLLILIGVFLFNGGEEEAQDIAEQDIQEQSVPAAEETEKVVPEEINTPPGVRDAEFSMAQGSNELAIKLTAEDAEGDPLSYEVLSFPLHGKLSGQAPDLLYIPSKDFAGEDSFMYRVSDGSNISQPANVKISSALVQVAAPSPVVTKKASSTAAAKTRKKSRAKPKKLVIAAKNKSYRVNSTDELLIDWEDIWSSANYLPFTDKVKVEVVSSKLKGSVKKLGTAQSMYVPDMYFGGKDNIKYRFKLGKIRSKVKQLSINVKLGTPPPTIKLAKMSKQYVPGETVVIDAQGSRDEDRGTVQFSWQQISGVPVQMQFLNEEESQAAFVVPSSFNTVANPGPVIRLTATDADGQKDTRDIKVSTRSRRSTAMWRGLAGGGIADDPACPYENCPGGLLPWPYDD